MGLDRRSFQGLARRTQALAEGIWNATIRVGGREYQAATTGGEFELVPRDLGGTEVVTRRSFRVDKAAMKRPPKSGDVLHWVRTLAEGGEQELRVVDVPQRPHETSWLIHCQSVHE